MSSNDAAVITEFFEDKFKQLVEVLSLILQNTKHIPEIKSDFKELKDDMKAVKKVLKITNADTKLLERRVTNLENAR